MNRRTLLVGDVHGCARSLDTLIRKARPDHVILLGDLFAKGPDPRAVWDLIRDVRPDAVLGNHDERVLQRWEGPDDSVHYRAAQQLPDEARVWLEGLPLFLHGEGWVGVHAGLHPTEGVPGTTRKMALTMRRWPDDADLANPFWWELYALPERVYYGHDAMRGVQHHARTVGLDSGAVYGGPLTGLVLEEDEPVSVPGWETDSGF